MLGFIGSLLGGNWQHRGDGTLYLSTFGSLGAADGMSAENITKSEIDGDAFTVTDVVWTDGDYSKADDDVQGVIEFTNPLDVEREGVLEQLRAKLIGKSYHGGTIHRQGAGWYELGDIVTAARKDGDPLPILISGIDYTISGGAFTERDYSSALTNSESNYTVSDSYAQSSGGSGGGTGAGTLTEYTVLSDTSIKYNGVTYTVELADSGLISKITDDKGGAFEPTFADVSNIALQNATFMAVAMLSGLKRAASDDIPNCFVRFNLDDYSADGTTITLHNQAGDGDYVATQAAVSDGGVSIDTANGGCGIATLTTTQSLEWTCYLVIKGGTGTDRGFYLIDGTNEWNWRLCFGSGGSAYWVSNVNGTVINSTQDKTQKCVLACACKEGARAFYANGILVGSDSLTGISLGTTIKMVSGRYGGSYYDGGTPQTAYDVALAATAHDAATVGEVSAMLMQKYNITGG